MGQECPSPQSRTPRQESPQRPSVSDFMVVNRPAAINGFRVAERRPKRAEIHPTLARGVLRPPYPNKKPRTRARGFANLIHISRRRDLTISRTPPSYFVAFHVLLKLLIASSTFFSVSASSAFFSFSAFHAGLPDAWKNFKRSTSN